MIIPKFKQFSQKQTCLFGAMLGDALGVPFEFKPAKNILVENIRYPNRIPKTYKTYQNVALGIYSDDFSQSLCVEECINNSDLSFNEEMLEWMEGKYWVDDTLFDIGTQTSRALSHYRMHKTILHMENGSGNGGIMRLAPVAFAPGIDHNWGIFVREVMKYAELTHNNPECISSALFYVTLLALVKNREYHDTFDHLWSEAMRMSSWSPANTLSKAKLGSGYVIDTLMAIRHCMKSTSSYQAAVTMAISFGGDTDTTATCVGAVAALYYGVDDIPDEWIEYIQPSLTDPYVQKLFKGVL